MTTEQYDKAIRALCDASTQLEPDGKGCACCRGSGHQAFECGFNPLIAMALCHTMAQDARELHQQLHDGMVLDPMARLHEIVHYVAGYDSRMVEQVGPAKIRMP